MYYYKKGRTYVASPIEIPSAESITKSEYNRIREIIHSRPTAPEGCGYRLTDGLEWELYELPDESEAQLSAEETLEIILGGMV